MRQRILFAVFILLFTVFVWTPTGLTASTAVKVYRWQDKLSRGAINIVTSPVEVARQIHNTTQEKNLLVGWTVGLAQGLGEGLVRFGAGVIDLVTCPFNFPDSRKGPLLDPEFVWEKPGPKYI